MNVYVLLEYKISIDTQQKPSYGRQIYLGMVPVLEKSSIRAVFSKLAMTPCSKEI